MALGEITLIDWWRVMRREIISGFLMGVILGTIGFFRILLWAQFSDIYGQHWFFIALTLFFTLIGVVMCGTLSGSMLPFILKKIGLDPATSSAPFVATLVDVTGLVIYFTVAMTLLTGKIL
jgi:magnesium transporter